MTAVQERSGVAVLHSLTLTHLGAGHYARHVYLAQMVLYTAIHFWQAVVGQSDWHLD